MSVKGIIMFLGMNNTRLERKILIILDFENGFLPTYLPQWSVWLYKCLQEPWTFYYIKRYQNNLVSGWFFFVFFQSLDRRKFGYFERAHSIGALNFGYMAEDGILRGSVDPFVHFTSATESKQSLGQFSDHIDKYRDVALWFMIFCWFWARSLHWSAKFGSNDRRWKSICPGIPFKIPLHSGRVH